MSSSSIAAAASSSSAAAANNDDENEQPQRRDPKLLRSLLAEAVLEEDYALASRLKLELEAADPTILLRLRLEEAVKEERYADATDLKSQIDALRPPPPPRFEPGPTTSDTVTNGIRVKVKSFFVASQSVARSPFTFAYRIKISNETGNGGGGGSGVGGGGGGSGDGSSRGGSSKGGSGKTFQLLSRSWEIVDGGDGTEANPTRTERVRGPGVVGETPVLAPGQSFSYSSFAQLRTAAGTMRGTYTFVEVEREEEEEEEEEGGEDGEGTAAAKEKKEGGSPAERVSLPSAARGRLACAPRRAGGAAAMLRPCAACFVALFQLRGLCLLLWLAARPLATITCVHLYFSSLLLQFLQVQSLYPPRPALESSVFPPLVYSSAGRLVDALLPGVC